MTYTVSSRALNSTPTPTPHVTGPHHWAGLHDAPTVSADIRETTNAASSQLHISPSPIIYNTNCSMNVCIHTILLKPLRSQKVKQRLNEIKGKQVPSAYRWETRGMTKYRRGPQRSITQDHRGSTKDCKWTLWARLQEIGTNQNQWCIIFQRAPRFLKIRSFTSVFILWLLGTHWFALSKFLFLFCVIVRK